MKYIFNPLFIKGNETVFIITILVTLAIIGITTYLVIKEVKNGSK